MPVHATLALLASCGLLLAGCTVACTDPGSPWRDELARPELDAAGFTAACADGVRQLYRDAEVIERTRLELVVLHDAEPVFWHLLPVWQQCRDDPDRRVAAVEGELDRLFGSRAGR